jgi:hypothetical protein
VCNLIKAGRLLASVQNSLVHARLGSEKWTLDGLREGRGGDQRLERWKRGEFLRPPSKIRWSKSDWEAENGRRSMLPPPPDADPMSGPNQPKHTITQRPKRDVRPVDRTCWPDSANQQGRAGGFVRPGARSCVQNDFQRKNRIVRLPVRVYHERRRQSCTSVWRSP